MPSSAPPARGRSSVTCLAGCGPPNFKRCARPAWTPPGFPGRFRPSGLRPRASGLSPLGLRFAPARLRRSDCQSRPVRRPGLAAGPGPRAGCLRSFCSALSRCAWPSPLRRLCPRSGLSAGLWPVGPLCGAVRALCRASRPLSASPLCSGPLGCSPCLRRAQPRPLAAGLSGPLRLGAAGLCAPCLGPSGAAPRRPGSGRGFFVALGAAPFLGFSPLPRCVPRFAGMLFRDEFEYRNQSPEGSFLLRFL